MRMKIRMRKLFAAADEGGGRYEGKVDLVPRAHLLHHKTH